MKFLSAQIKQQKGFTLIELLIVIAILGILSTAVLSAINPVEQISRGRDTGTQSDAEQLLTAIQRFNASQGYYPWQTGATDTASLPTGWTKVDMGAVAPNGWTVSNAAPAPAANPAVAGNNVLDIVGSQEVNATHELQNAFIDRITDTGYNFLYVFNRGQQGDSTYICFRPQSKQFKDDAIERCISTPADFPAAQACVADNEYVCLP